MNISSLSGAESLFLPAWENASRRRECPKSSDQMEDATEAFNKAKGACDREAERMMDRHHESVAKSAKERVIYQKKKAMIDRVRIETQKKDMFNETVMIQRLNHRNMLKENLMKDLSQDEINKARKS